MADPSAHQTPSVAQLRGIDLFAELSGAELEEWAAAATLHRAQVGDRVVEYGQRPRGLILVIEGRLDTFVPDGGAEARLDQQIAPTWVEAIPTLIGTPSLITMQATEPVLYAMIPREPLTTLVRAHEPVFERAMTLIRPVLGRVAQREHQHERLESLGTMAAGLAHELNNPASAAKQAAGDLSNTLTVLSEAVGTFIESDLNRHQATELVAIQTAALERCMNQTSAPRVSSLDAVDLEDALTDQLTGLGVPEPWTLAATLAAAGIDPPFLHQVASSAGPLTGPVVRWITASLSARQLAAELAQSTDQMSQLVSAIKNYAYMDRGEIVEVDLHEGLDTTLTILGHKLKRTTITVTRRYDPALGKVLVYGAELNQVWTNLLDNAIDALGDSGQITITTFRDGDCAEVAIADDGPGVPAEVRARVFDPFFTTKEVGRGTGLGLDTARRIVVERHHGSLSLDTSTDPPTGTRFTVRIPIDAVHGQLTSVT